VEELIQNQASPAPLPERGAYREFLQGVSSTRRWNLGPERGYRESLAPILEPGKRPVKADLVPQANVAHSAVYPGRVAAVDGSRVIIEFEVEGEDEEREFAREDLNIGDDLLKVGCRVVATTSLEFPAPTQPPTPEQQRAIRARREELEKECSEIDPRQTPIFPGIEP
jgi:hypothetical protein